MKELLNIAIAAAKEAGAEILKIYNGEDFNIELKGDDSPLTQADKNAHNIIMEHLGKTNIPVLSEEGRAINYEERKVWDLLWIVDPLDGTKEFIKRNGEFTVNIALIKKGEPIIGVIYVPVKNWLYYGSEGSSYKINEEGELLKLPMNQENGKFKAVGSRSHLSKETEEYFEKLKQKHGEIEVVSMGSSLKICLVAEGAADVYPRFAPTMEWDTAAGDAIARNAGKTVIDYKTEQPMKYNRPELLNNWFIVQ